jgi:hypothetical protein
VATVSFEWQSWAHNLEPKSKQQAIEWDHTTPQNEEEFKTVLSAENIMATVFWNEKLLFL